MANKKDIVAEVRETGLSLKDSTAVVDAVIASITSKLEAGEAVKISGFGTFEVRDRAARKGTNPQTGEVIDIPAKKVPAFRASRNLKDAVK